MVILNKRSIYLTSIALLIAYLLFANQMVIDFANKFYIQDFSIYLKSLDYDLSQNSDLFPHQLSYVEGSWGEVDKSSTPLRNWGMPVSMVSIIPIWLFPHDLWKLGYLVLLFSTPIAILQLSKSKDIFIIFLLIIGPILSNLYWGGLGLILVLYSFLIHKYSKTYFAQFLFGILFLYKPQLVAPVIVFLAITFFTKGQWRVTLPFVYSVIFILSVSFIFYSRSWQSWIERDFSIPLRYMANTPGISSLLRLAGFERVYLFAPVIFLSTLLASAWLGIKSKKDNFELVSQKALAVFSLGVVLSPYVWLHDWIITSLGVSSGLSLYLYRNRSRSTKLVIYFSLILISLSESWYIWNQQPVLIVLPFLTRLMFVSYYLFSGNDMHHISDKEGNDGIRSFHQKLSQI